MCRQSEKNLLNTDTFSTCPHSYLLWPPCVADADIIFLSCVFFSFSSPNLTGRRLDVCHRSTHDVVPSAKLECRCETCCTRLAEKCRTQNSPKSRHLRTIVQLCRAISSHLRHVSTIGKKLVKQQYLLQMFAQYGELRPTSG